MDARRFEEAGAEGGAGGSEGEDATRLDVAFVGASLTNLASAVAICSAFEGIRVKVYEEAEDLGRVEDFLLSISSGAWKALSAVSSIATKALLHRGLVYSIGAAPEGCPWGSDDSCLPACSLRTLLELLGSLLPAGALCLGTRLDEVVETAEGVTFKESPMISGACGQVGEAVVSKLMVRSPDCPLGDVEPGSLQKTGFIEADIVLQSDGACPPEVSEWRDGKNLVVWRPLLPGTAALSCLLGSSTEDTEVTLEGTLNLLRDFPGVRDVLEGSSRVVSWAGRDIWTAIGAEPNARGRITSTGRASERIPGLSSHRAESAFTHALLLRCSLSDRGLTPAALRDFEGLSNGNGLEMAMDKEAAAQAVDWLDVWGLLKGAALQLSWQPAWGDECKLGAGMCDVAFARGLKSAMPVSGMGWRIVS